jgi:hypothetical protein
MKDDIKINGDIIHQGKLVDHKRGSSRAAADSTRYGLAVRTLPYECPKCGYFGWEFSITTENNYGLNSTREAHRCFKCHHPMKYTDSPNDFQTPMLSQIQSNTKD